MKNVFSLMDVKTMVTFNFVAVVITGICEIFAVSTYITKSSDPNLEQWKYIALIIGVVVVSLLFVGSLISMVFFIRMKNKKSKEVL